MRRCIHFAQRDGYGSLEVANLYAYVATDPDDLRRAGYPVGPGNDEHIAATVRACDRVVLAWGARLQCVKRADDVLRLLHGLEVAPYCLRLTRSGHPEHPLRLPSTCGLQLFRVIDPGAGRGA